MAAKQEAKNRGSRAAGKHRRHNKIVNDYPADATYRSIEGSPNRLSTDQIDISVVHDVAQEWIVGIDVCLTLGVAPETLAHLDRALAQFTDFCTASQRMKSGIPLTVTVAAPDGRVLKHD